MMRSHVAWGLAAAELLVFFIAVALDPGPNALVTILFAAGIGAYVGIGALLVSRVPANPIGTLLIATGTIGTASAVVSTYANRGALQSPPWPGVELAQTVRDAIFIYPILIALVLIPLVFPDGHLPSRRFRWVVVLTAAGAIGWMLGSVFELAVDGVVLVSVPVAFGGAVTAVTLRFRRGDQVQRQQVKWLAAVVVVGASSVLAGLLVNGINEDLGTALVFVGVLALFALPFVIGVAILRYRLYEIDRIISRTLSYAIVTGILGAVFVGVVLVLQTVLADITGNRGIPVAVSTLAVFALFQPILRRVRHAVDRRFDRARYDGERTTSEFAERLRWETDMERVTSDLRATVASAVLPRSLGIWLRAGRPNR